MAQVDDIKDNAKKNDTDNKNNTNNSEWDTDWESSNTEADLAGACFEAIAQPCAAMCFDIVFNTIGEILAEHHKDIMKMENTPFRLSLEVRPHAAYSSDYSSLNLLPGIRGNWGIASTDFRLNYLAEFDNLGIELYRTYEWQVFILNLVPTQQWRLSLGSGFMYESYTQNYYNEHYFGTDLYLNNNLYAFNLEARAAFDYSSTAIVNNIFHEVNFRGNLRIFDISHVGVYAAAGLSYQNYYLETPIFALQMGLTFNIH